MIKGHKNTLYRQRYKEVKAGLEEYRIDPYIRKVERRRGKKKGTILPFVRGLRFTALLIYKIRNFLGKDLTANWGHIIDDDGELSRECDIIIHETGDFEKWNGESGEHIMDFRFIEKESVKAVISCKSYLTSSTIEREYCNDLHTFCDNVWLFAECIGPKSYSKVKEKSLEHGYSEFWYLYTWNKTDTTDAYDIWLDFVEKVKKLK